MGLDLTIYGTSNYGQDENGRTTWTMTVLDRLHNCWNINEILAWKFEEYSCGTNMYIEFEQLQEILQELKDNLQEVVTGKLAKWNNETEEHYKKRCESKKVELESEIREFELTLTNEDNLNFDEYYVHGSW